MMQTLGFQHLPLETARFGIESARLTAEEPDQVPGLVEAARSAGVRLLITRIPVVATGLLHALEHSGFRLMDTLVYYERDLERNPPDASLFDARVRPATAADRDRLAAVAHDAFRGYVGHFHADPGLDSAEADAAYVDWARRSLEEPGVADAVVVGEVDGVVSAFGTFREEADGRCDFALAGVAAPAQRGGLYRAIAASGILWAGQRGCRVFQSSTQLPNVGVQKVWVRLLMEPARAYHTLHRWL